MPQSICTYVCAYVCFRPSATSPSRGETVIRDVNLQTLAIDKENRCKCILIPWINFLTLDLNDLVVHNHRETVLRHVNVQNLAIDKENRCKSILIPWINILTLDLNDLVARPSLNCRCLVLGAKTDACVGL